MTTQRTTRSQAQTQFLSPEEQHKQEESEAAEQWRKITEEHHKEKEVEERRRAREQDKGKAKVQEEQIVQDSSCRRNPLSHKQSTLPG